MTLYRCFPWKSTATPADTDGPLWCPRPYQGEGRHDTPEAYGCLYLSDRPLSCVVEMLAPFRGQRLIVSMLTRRGLPLALARLELAPEAVLLDLDDPAVLRRERLRPSLVATRQRHVPQAQAHALFRRHPGAAGLRWWSSWEAQWTNVTLFDRALPLLRVAQVEALTMQHPATQDAAEWFGLRPA